MISLRNVSKCFKLYGSQRARLMELLGLRATHQPFWALRDVSLEVPRGRTVGIVGANGAGKSTLLKLITRTLLPTTGEIDVQGRVAALLELGMGFHPEFTGRQNIHINGQLLGLSPEEIQSLEAGIIAFSELGSFIDQPLRTYSSGMVVRLGFSIAAALDPEVLIVDEALSVGDARFSQKCIRRIRQFREAGATILFVSHDPAAVSSLCEEAVLLHEGQLRSRGAPKEILEEYNALLAAVGEGNVAMRTVRPSAASGSSQPTRSGTFQVLVTDLRLLDKDGRRAEVYTVGERMTVEVEVLFLAPVKAPTVGVQIKERLGLQLFGTNTALKGIDLGAYEAGESLRVRVEIPLRLGYGDYSLTVAVHEDETHLDACYEWTDNAAVFSVRSRGKETWSGLVLHEAEMQFDRINPPDAPGEWIGTLEDLFPELPDKLPMQEEDIERSPFLSGFSPASGEEGRIYRVVTAPRAVLLVPVRHGTPVRLLLDASAPVTVKASWLGTSHGTEAVVDSDESEVTIPLPPDWPRKVAVLLLEVEEVKANLRLYEVSLTERRPTLRP